MPQMPKRVKFRKSHRNLARGLRRLVSIDPEAAAEVVGALVDRLVETGALVRAGDLVRARGLEPSGLDPLVVAAMDRLEQMLDRVVPPPLAEAAGQAGCSPEGVRLLETEGRIVPLDTDLAYARRAFDGLQATALDLARAGSLTPAALRDATGTSRKYVMGLLEELGRRGVLARTTTGHVPGPRAPR